MTSKGLIERLNNGENILVAEGYMYETERRGYLKFGSFAPEVVLDNPDMVRSMHREFVHAGSDVVEAFTYYGHRERLKLIGREESLEKLNRTALRIAREVADETGTLMAGGLCSTTIYEKNKPEIDDRIRAMFKEQVEWAVEEGADFIIAETLNDYAEAKLALEAILQYGKCLPAVITIVCYNPDKTLDDVPIAEACCRLEVGGAAVVGLNCGRGPETMLPLIREIRKTCTGPIAALPVAFRTTEEDHSWTSLKDPKTGKHAWPANLSCMACSREDIRQFAEKAKAIGVNYVGLCCGNAPFFFREVAEVYGRKPGASKYSPDMSLSVLAGDSKDSYSKLRVYAGTGKK